LHLTSQTFAIPLLFKKQRVPVVVSVMDLIPLLKEYRATSFLERILFRISCAGLKRADALIAISECTKQDMIRLLHIPKEKIFVTPLAADSFTPKKMKREYATVLYIGSELPRKNLATLIHAIAIVKKKIPEIKFIKMGTPQTREKNELQTLIKQLDLQKNIIISGYTPDITSAYATATVFAFPSLYEGFGLPILEAMTLGCPVISSNSSSLPEVGGDAVLYVNPTDVNAWADAITSVIRNKELQEELSKKGVTRAQHFSWDRVATETHTVYKAIGAHP
jgi:glycosyltransferase involved in cell wall biosynthesis